MRVDGEGTEEKEGEMEIRLCFRPCCSAGSFGRRRLAQPGQQIIEIVDRYVPLGECGAEGCKTQPAGPLRSYPVLCVCLRATGHN